jgi:hypothetical protein
MSDQRFDGMSDAEIQALLDAMMAPGPPDNELDADFLKALALEIGLRQSRNPAAAKARDDG